jgi:hypothetical protein
VAIVSHHIFKTQPSKQDLKVYDDGTLIQILLLDIIHRPVLYTTWCRCPEMGTNSIDWIKLGKFYLKTDTQSSLRNSEFDEVAEQITDGDIT